MKRMVDYYGTDYCDEKCDYIQHLEAQKKILYGILGVVSTIATILLITLVKGTK